MDNSSIPEELRWAEADQAKFGTPNEESIKHIDDGNEKHWEINGVEATKAEVERAGIQAILLVSVDDPGMATSLRLFLTTRNRSMLGDQPKPGNFVAYGLLPRGEG